MGSFYDNLHVRTEDRLGVEQAWQEFWGARNEESQAWISPPYGGWISVFDRHCDQQNVEALEELSAHLSRVLESVTLAFQVQDSDLAEYWLYHHGKRADHYNSNEEYSPTYLAGVGDVEKEGIYSGYGPDEHAAYPDEADNTGGGNVSLLKTLTQTTASDGELEAILRTPATFADDILTALASAIGINDIWASVGYHYLATEGDTIPGIGQFKHLPEGQPPKAGWFEE